MGFLINDTVMLWITIAALIVSVGFLAFRAKRRRGYKPFWTGLTGSLLIITGKFIIDIPFLFYSGLALLIAASLWNSWPRKNSKTTVSTPYSKMEEEK
ncbi:MerC domain-containing protein [Desulfomarina profundi]|uniref:MerC domain-containing protein n=1 Tax=Desulfomarina profundi TaxID=2772557 RepID=UPI0038B40005